MLFFVAYAVPVFRLQILSDQQRDEATFRGPHFQKSAKTELFYPNFNHLSHGKRVEISLFISLYEEEKSLSSDRRSEEKIYFLPPESRPSSILLSRFLVSVTYSTSSSVKQFQIWKCVFLARQSAYFSVPNFSYITYTVCKKTTPADNFQSHCTIEI